MDVEETAEINSEIRYLSLELMKIAETKKSPFEKVLKEYIKNTFTLQKELYRTAQGPISSQKKKKSKTGKKEMRQKLKRTAPQEKEK